MIDDAGLAPGARVSIRGKPVGITLTGATGTFVKADEYEPDPNPARGI